MRDQEPGLSCEQRRRVTQFLMTAALSLTALWENKVYQRRTFSLETKISRLFCKGFEPEVQIEWGNTYLTY